MSAIHDLLKPYKAFFQNYGYSLKGGMFYKIENDIAFCFSFSNISLIYCDYYFIPLYIPAPCRYFTYGNRLEALTRLAVRPFVKSECFEDWMNDVTKVAANEIIPFFDKISSPEKLISLINRNDPSFDHFTGCSRCNKGILCIYTNLYLERYRDAEKNYSDIYEYLQNSNDARWTDIEEKELNEIKSTLMAKEKEDISEYLKSTVINTAKACRFA